MHQRKRHRLYPQCVVPKFARVPKQYPSTEQKFPTDEIQESCPCQTIYIRFIIRTHGFIPMTQIINDRCHEKNADCSDRQSRLPIAEGQAKLLWVFAKEEDDNQKWDEQIKNDPIPIFVLSEPVIIIHHEQKGTHNCDGDNFPVKV